MAVNKDGIQTCPDNVHTVQNAVRNECAAIAQAEADYWRRVRCADVPGAERFAASAAAAIFGAIISGKTAAEHRAELAGRGSRAAERRQRAEVAARFGPGRAGNG